MIENRIPRWYLAVLVVILCTCGPARLYAQWTTEEISIFKPGKSYVHQVAEVTPRAGRFIERLSIPNLVSDSYELKELFEVYTGSETLIASSGEIKRVWTSLDTTISTEEIDGYNFNRLLELNEGQVMNVVTTSGRRASGMLTLVDVGNFLLLNDGEYSIFRTHDLAEFSFPAGAITSYVDSTELTGRYLNAELANPVGQTKLSLYYLAGGIKWMPLYQLQLLGNNRLKLQLDAQIINEQQDFKDVRLNLGIGQPKFALSDLPSQLLSSENKETETNYIEMNNSGNLAFSNVITSQVRTPGASGPRNASMGDGDVFFYEIPNFTLPYRQTGQERITEIEVTYQDSYRATMKASNPQPVTVWHHLDFINSSEFPLTTGGAFVVDAENKPVGQQRLDFTPPGSKCSVRISATPEIVISTSVKENGFDEELINYEGIINVENYRSEPATVTLELSLTGPIRRSSDNYTYNGNYQWTVNVTAGGAREITYDYQTRR